MPINFQDIHQQVLRWGEDAPRRERIFRQTRENALRILESWSGREVELQARLAEAAGAFPALRSAIPTRETLDSHHPLPDVPTGGVTLLAADGSQINPDRHAAVEYCVINVGAFEVHTDLSAPPRERIQSELLDEKRLFTPNGLITEEMVALHRDLKERRFLAGLAREFSPPVITLTDGPLELFWGRESTETPEFRALFEEYLKVLADLSRLGVTAAGYVDKPRGDLLVRLLEIASLAPDQMEQAGRARPFLGINDAQLLRDRLAPGERSALFAILTSSARHYQGDLALHFFYLNVGRPEAPWITRVEVPAWVAADPALLDPLHTLLVSQCRVLGTRPYPYALHRAHEIAVVSLAEKGQVDQMIIAEMYRRGVPVGEMSAKQGLKDLPTRTRNPR